jgi:predicted ATPase/DNA-binding SARP family transcriptional activator/tetratricopeptide (TPR) repeat protein
MGSLSPALGMIKSGRCWYISQLRGNALILWPDQSEKAAHDSLRNALSRLRHAIGDQEAQPPYLIINHDEIQFNPQSDAWLDVNVFISLLDACEHHIHNSLDSCPECLERLEQAAAMYQGCFLVDFYLLDSQSFEEWCTLIREQLQRRVRENLHLLIAAHSRRNELSQALPYAYRLVELEPLDEDSHRQLLRLLALNGQTNEALAQYKLLEHLLANELGVEPEEEIQALYHQILSETRREQGTSNLPASLTSFIGREAELAEIKGRLEDPGCRLLTILGPGGVGKTRLAVEAARALRYDFPHGMYLVPLSTLHGPEALVLAISDALCISPGKIKNLRQQVLDYTRLKSLLLVMDSFEQVQEENYIAAELLREAPGLKILATSREQLNIEGEQVYFLKGMKYPSPDQQEAIEKFSAVQLFSAGARRNHPDFKLSKENAAGVVRVCQLVQGMPLGLLLACAWVVEYSPAEIAGEIEKNLDFLSAEGRDVPERQRSLRATFDYSWDLLKDSEREALCRLSVFRANFTRPMAEEVAQVTALELRNLVEKSLLIRSQDGHYVIHDLLRQYSCEKLARAPDLESSIRQRHSQYFMEALERWATEQKGTGQLAALTEMDQELADVQSAWKWVCQHEYLVGLARGCEGLCCYYQYRYRYVQGENDCQVALDVLEDIAELNPEGQRLKARLLAYQSSFQFKSGRIGLSNRRQMLEKCFQILEGLQQAGNDVRQDVAWILKEMGLAISEIDPKRAIQLIQHSLDIARQTSDHRCQAISLEALGFVYYYWQHELQEAEGYYQAALTEWRLLGDAFHITKVQGYLSQISIYLGKVELNLQAERESAQLYRSKGDRVNYADSLTTLRTILWFGRQWVESDRTYRDSLPHVQDIGDLDYINETYSNWCLVKTFLGQYETVRTMAQNNLERANQLDDTYAKLVINYALGCVDLAQGQVEQAAMFLEKAATIANQHGNRAHWAWAAGTWSLALVRLGHLKQAQELLVKALQICLEEQSYPSLSFTVPAAALMLTITGQVERAVELCELIDERAICGKTPWFEDVAGKTIKEMAASLAPEVLEAARKRGRQRGLFSTALELLEEFRDHP